VHKTTI
jgi:hypothetical protein